MRRISTYLIVAICSLASARSYGQCTFNTTAPTGAPGATNNFTSDAEGFTGDFTYSASGGGHLVTNPSGSGSRELITPIFFRNPSTSTIIVRFTLDRTASADVTGYSVTAETAANPSIALCSGTLTGVSPNSPTVYYLSIPATSIPASTNFKLHITFTVTGTYNLDAFGANVATSNGTLPVTFLSFDSKSTDAGVVLQWNVADESGLDHYEIEKSSNGFGFTSMGKIAATGASSYSFADVKPAAAVTYYRVKSVDRDGKFGYSTILTLKTTVAATSLKAFPTPARQNVVLQYAMASKYSHIEISSEDGQVVKAIVPAYASQQTTIDLSGLKAGLYLVRFSDGSGVVNTVKLIKQ